MENKITDKEWEKLVADASVFGEYNALRRIYEVVMDRDKFSGKAFDEIRALCWANSDCTIIDELKKCGWCQGLTDTTEIIAGVEMCPECRASFLEWMRESKKRDRDFYPSVFFGRRNRVKEATKW